MNYMRIIKVLLITIFFQTYSMEQAPQLSQTYNFATFSGLPVELKEYLLPFVVSGPLKYMLRGLYNLAALDKKNHARINDPQRMIRILNSLPRICNGISLIERLQKKQKSLPVLQSKDVQQWLTSAKNMPLKNGPELMDAIDDFYALKSVRKLLQKKDINLHWYSYRNTLLSRAITNADAQTVIEFLNAGIDPNEKDERGDTALFTAVRYHKRYVQLLLRMGADPNYKNKFGDTPLLYALNGYSHPEIDVIKCLLDAGANPNVWGAVGKSARDVAQETGYIEIVALLDEVSTKNRK